LTISGACTDSNGNTTLSAAQYPKIAYYLVNGDQFDFNCPTYTPSGYLMLNQDLKPGECINIWPQGVSGNTIMYINADHAVPECGAFAGPTSAPGCYDNWADVKTGGTCQPQTSTSTSMVTVPAYLPTTYQASTTTATCPAGSAPQWSVFTYDSLIPSNSSGQGSVLIQAQVAPVVNGVVGKFGPWVTFANTAPPSNDPAVCPFVGGLGPCPKDIFALLGGLPAAADAAMNLRVVLTPTPDGQAIPELIGWQVAFSCVNSE
jgi:hypothetical protein